MLAPCPPDSAANRAAIDNSNRPGARPPTRMPRRSFPDATGLFLGLPTAKRMTRKHPVQAKPAQIATSLRAARLGVARRNAASERSQNST